MDSVSALGAAERFEESKCQGVEIKDETDSTLGRAYKKLHVDATAEGHTCVVSEYNAFKKAQYSDQYHFFNRNDKPMGLLMASRPELATSRRQLDTCTFPWACVYVW